MIRTPLLPAAALILAASVAFAQAPQPQPPKFTWPERMQNPQVFKPDTPPDRLQGIMRDFTATLGVRCSHCHVGVEGQPLSTYDFASDANPRKEVARGMVRMVTRLNREILPEILRPAREQLQQPLVNCYTCHRGAADPALVPPAASPKPDGQRGGST
jgi:hypothetical protein